MSCRRRSRVFWLAALILSFAGCSKQRPAAQKVAVLPFENLSADPRLDWMGRAFSEILTAQLTGCPNIDPVSLASLRDAPAAGSGAVLQGYYSLSAGSLHVQAVLMNSAENRTEKSASASGSQGGVIELAGSLAKQIDSAARPFSTRNPEALRAWLDALGAPTEAAGAEYQRALSADPDFGAAYVSYVQWLATRGERGEAAKVIASTEKNSRIAPVERARLGLLAAALRGDRAGERHALVELVRLTPADGSLYRTLANMDLMARAYPDAARWYEQALARDPGNVTLLNEAGYAYAYARDLESAKKALTRYRELRPREANPLDSLGDVHYYLGRFAEAEKYYMDAYAKAPAFLLGADLYKAAWARLMAGDLDGARQLFSRFIQMRQQFRDPLVPYRIAQWDYLTGRRKEALDALERALGTPSSPLANVAAVQLSVWALQAGDRARAREFALRAAPANPVAALCRFLAEPPATASEWTARAEQALPQPAQAPMRRYALAYALLLSNDFAAAAPRLAEIYRQTTPSSPDPVEVLLAWSLVETGRIKEAGDLLSINPVPEPMGEHPFLTLSFPRMLELRGLVLRKEGRPEDAKPSLELFQRLSAAQP